MYNSTLLMTTGKCCENLFKAESNQRSHASTIERNHLYESWTPSSGYKLIWSKKMDSVAPFTESFIHEQSVFKIEN